MKSLFRILGGIVAVTAVSLPCVRDAVAETARSEVRGATVTGGSATGGSATAVGGTAVGGSAAGGSAVGGSVRGGDAVGGSAVGGSAVGGSATSATATSGTATPGSATATVGGRQIRASGDAAVRIDADDRRATVGIGVHRIVIEHDRVVVDGRDAAPLAPSAGDVRITLHSGRLSVRADGAEVVSQRLAAP